MYKGSLLLGFSLLVFLEGCGPVFRVNIHDANKPSGIPFYSVVGACTQQTVYANPYFLITLKVSGASGVILTDTVKLSLSGYQSADFRNLATELDKPTPELGTVQTAWGLLKQRQSFNPYTQSNGEFLLMNASKVSATVDYAHAYSLNQSKPFAGTVSGDYKLSSDGTLGEVQGQVEDQTLSTILSALPISDLIKSAAGIAAKAGAAEAEKPQTVHFSLEQEERIRTKTYSRMSAYIVNCPTGNAITDTDTPKSMVLADIGAKEISSSKADTNKTDSSIGISGTISLPKALLQPSTKDDNVSSGGKPASNAPKANDNAAKPKTKSPGNTNNPGTPGGTNPS